MSSLTVVIATTGRDTLERAYRSALHAADDVIIVADGCPDLVHADLHVDLGCPGLVRNAAAPLVRSTHVGFLDDDDVLIPDVYRRVALEVHPAAAMVIHTMLHPELGPVPRPGQPITLGNVGISFTCQTSLWRDRPFIAGPHRNKINGTMRGEDFELVRRFQDHGLPVALSPHIAYVVRPEEHSWPW